MPSFKTLSFKTYRLCILALCLLSLPLNPHCAQAQTAAQQQALDANESPAFFSAISDLPVMPGLTEMESDSSIYDVPEGRIVTLYARADNNISPEQIRAYYEKILPQFGWLKRQPDSYIREHETLGFSYQKADDSLVIEITLEP